MAAEIRENRAAAAAIDAKKKPEAGAKPTLAQPSAATDIELRAMAIPSTASADSAPASPTASAPTPAPAKGWRERLEAAYRLKEGELVKHIPPPFVPERAEYYHNDEGLRSQAEAIPEPPTYLTFHEDETGWYQWGLGFMGSDKPSMSGVLRHVFGLKSYEIEGSAALLKLSLEGDWTLREGTERNALLRALETILRDETKRTIHFEKRAVELEVVVVRGVSNAENETEKRIQIYAETAADTGAGGGTGNMGEFLAHAADRLGIPFVNETTGGDQERLSWENHHDASFNGLVRRQDEVIAKVLKNLATQTGLFFTREKRPVEVWFVTEAEAGPVK